MADDTMITPPDFDRIIREIEAERERKRREKEKRQQEQDAAIAAEYKQREIMEDEKKKRHTLAARMLGNYSLGGNRIDTRIYWPKPEPIKELPYVAFRGQDTQRTVRLGDIAMARMPKRKL